MPKQINIEHNQKLMEGLMKLFWIKGYMATSIDDLADETGLSKSYIYTNYGKKGMFEEAFCFYLKNYTDPFLEALESDTKGVDAFRDKLGMLVDSLINNTMPKACLFVNTVVEIGDKDHDIVSLNEMYINHVTDMYRKKLNYCLSLGEIQNAEAIPLYTNILVNILFSLAVLYKTHTKPELMAFIDAQLALIK